MGVGRRTSKMKCIKMTTKKYLTRKSPPYPARTCQDTMRKGKDGMYKSVPDVTGRFRWVKV